VWALSKVEVFYEVDASELKNADRAKRYLRTLALFAMYFLILLVLYQFLFEFSLIVLFVILMFTPPAIIPSIAKYRITNFGIIDPKERAIPLRPEYRFVANEQRKFVSVYKGRRQIFMLYTPEPMRVMRILERVSKIAKPPEEMLEAEEIEPEEGETPSSKEGGD